MKEFMGAQRTDCSIAQKTRSATEQGIFVIEVMQMIAHKLSIGQRIGTRAKGIQGIIRNFFKN